MKRIIIFIALLFLGSCSDSSGITASSGAKVIAFGDSLTVSLGAKQGTYPERLANITGLQVIASGVSGEQTHEGLRRLPSVLAEHDADILVLLEGGNDFLRNQREEAVKGNLAAMIELAQQHGMQVVLVAVPQKSLFLSDAPLYEELAQQYDVTLVANVLSDLLGDNDYKSDQIHLNDKGYERLAQAVAEVIAVN